MEFWGCFCWARSLQRVLAYTGTRQVAQLLACAIYRHEWPLTHLQRENGHQDEAFQPTFRQIILSSSFVLSEQAESGH